MANENAVPVPGTGSRSIRTNTVTETIAGVATAVDQQIVGLSDPLGNVVDLNANDRTIIDLLRLVGTELRITNFLLVEGLNIKLDLDALRADPAFGISEVS